MGMWWLFPVCCNFLLFHFSFSHSFCHPHDNLALLHFKASLTINTMYSSYHCHQVYPTIATWENGTDCCSWSGVTCHPISGHVTAIDLTCGGLQGQINANSTLFSLSHMQSLNLAFNDFSNSQIPSPIGEFVNLTHLNLSFSNFQGEIPPQISHLSKLQSLDLSLQQLKWKEGTWKKMLQNATELRVLVLNYTDLSSTSMRSLNLSSSLITLSLGGIGLKGKLTNAILCLPNLQYLDLSGNFELHGQLPSLRCSSASLNVLQISGCAFQGPIPPSFSNLTSLTLLDLSYNSLNGSIPSSLLTLPRLNVLLLCYNHLSGQIPNVFHQSNRFEKLDLNCNNIQGFSNLALLSLTDNMLNGTIPSWCFSLPSLLYLSLSNNQFTGHIPAISSYSLQDLVLSDNKLQGNISESIFNLVNLTYLSLQLSLKFESSVNYSFSRLKKLDLSSLGLTEFPKLSKVPVLEILILSNNKLNGKVPNWLTTPVDQFSRNYQLRKLDLSYNLLTGGISSSICNASSLEILVLSNNKLTGTIPQCLASSSSLFILNLEMNRLNGTLPNTFSKYSLQSLNLNDNRLEGPLPQSLSNCMRLKILNLGNNQIEDTFPHWLRTLPFLKVLVLRANKLHGPIVIFKTEHGLPSLIIFDISSNNFSGPIPEDYMQNFEAIRILFKMSFAVYYSPMTVTTKGTSVPFKKIPTNFLSIDLSGNKFEGEIPNAKMMLKGQIKVVALQG
uniref:Leucine-rich repeat-containing N-terminal plant-type domain-containing protein n=1 Tax=Phaseolus vulgaris TaxID=3885 RepID=V7B992_PHAVU|nr:hypothetical protein PHAVU_008G277200g [Phaseolus vulgaris]ESW14394.1 hypothetical protein PHAVU_008G277200g [Phaseolus vulgaris]